MYAQNAASVNEFLGHSWDKVPAVSVVLLDRSNIASLYDKHFINLVIISIYAYIIRYLKQLHEHIHLCRNKNKLSK